MKNRKITLALAVFALTPAVLLAQRERSAPSVSEVVVTKATETATPSLNRPANAQLVMEFLESDKPVAASAHVDQALLREIHAARGTGKTLAAEVLAKDHFKSVKLHIRKGSSASDGINRAAKTNRPVKLLVIVVPVYDASGNAQPYLQMKLENVMVTSWSTSASNGPVPTDTFSLNFEKIKFEYKPQK
ncbi:MAG TPA: type VI secretion system tube protein Hcp [Fimbriimonadaceae bacterium]|nr:type VI secretion system tube protein Hcp [Fimbriimonadaceae bacterium]